MWTISPIRVRRGGVQMFRLTSLATALFMLSSYAIAQNATGTLDGCVTDASNAAVPGAAMTVENQVINVHWRLTTNSEGRFYQRYLQPGFVPCECRKIRVSGVHSE